MKAFLKVIPPLSYDLHKGQAGRIGIIGGCLEYTGAPYYAAMAAMKVGVDLVHIFCDYNAAIPLKSYSPDIIVHPYIMNDQQNGGAEPSSKAARQAADKIIPWLDRLHAVLIGPGLGRDEIMANTVRMIISEAVQRQLPIILDADALFALHGHYGLIKGYRYAILTPNAVEFQRLAQGLDIDSNQSHYQSDKMQLCKLISKALDGVNIVAKGKSDTICTIDELKECEEQASPRRCGGQGDILSGVITAFNAWAAIEGSTREKLLAPDIIMDCLLAACNVTRKSSYLCFQKYGRSMTASDMLRCVPESFEAVVSVARG